MTAEEIDALARIKEIAVRRHIMIIADAIWAVGGRADPTEDIACAISTATSCTALPVMRGTSWEA